MVKGFLSIIMGIVVLFPFLVTISFLILMRKRGKAPASVMGRAADWTTPFLFISVYIISSTIFSEGSGFVIGGVAILIALLFATNERMKEKEFRIARFIHKTWRLYFLILVLAYLVLIIIGLFMKVTEYVK